MSPVHRVGDALPAVLVLKDLEPLFGLGYDRLWQLEKAGELERFELKPQIGPRKRYSGKRVLAWLNGEWPAEASPARLVATQGRRR